LFRPRTPLNDGRADKFGAIETALTERGALGSSDLGQAMTWLSAHALKARVVVVPTRSSLYSTCARFSIAIRRSFT
jgi:hypothetical protein